MADITTQGSTLSVKLTMYRASDTSTKTRTFSVRDPAYGQDEGATFRAALQDLQNFLLGDGKTLIQPTGWRDEDKAEDEYTTTAVEFTTEDSTVTKWDTRLTHNMTISQSELNYQDVSTDLLNPTTLTINGTAIDAADLQVSSTMTGDVGVFVGWYQSLNAIAVEFIRPTGEDTVTGSITFTLPENGVYQEASVTVEFV